MGCLIWPLGRPQELLEGKLVHNYNGILAFNDLKDPKTIFGIRKLSTFLDQKDLFIFSASWIVSHLSIWPHLYYHIYCKSPIHPYGHIYILAVKDIYLFFLDIWKQKTKGF